MLTASDPARDTSARSPAPTWFRTRPGPLGAPRPLPQAGSGRITWMVLGLFGVVLVVHSFGWFGEATYSIVTLGGAACAVVGLRWHRPATRWPWWALMATAVLWTASSIASEVTGAWGDLTTSRSLVPDLLAFPGYLLFGAGLYGLARSSGAASERGAVLDGIMLAAGVSLLVYETLIAPTLTIPDAWIMARIMVAGYPALSMCLIVLAARLAFGRGERSPAFVLLLVGTAGLLIGDVIFAFGEIGRISTTRAVLEVPYLMVPACIGAALLHPSIRLVGHTSNQRARPLGPGRLLAVAGALSAPIVVLVLHGVTARTLVSIALCAVLALAAVVRMGAAMRAQAASEARLYHQATHDDLTGLPSRSLVVERIDRMLEHDPHRVVTLMFLDLDQFKFVNDSMGHRVGDDLLILVAERLVSTVRADDMVGRISGDEFLVLAGGLDTAGAHSLADRIRAALRDPFHLSAGEVFVSASIGVATTTGAQGGSAVSLIQEADTAMYHSKDIGRNAVTFFDASMRERVAHRVELERRLRHALDARRVAVWFQPVMTCPDGKLQGFEALARWLDDGQPVSPAQFIPIAEESGLIIPLGAHVLDEACRQLSWWRRTHPELTDLHVSVNLSARQMRAVDIVDMVAETLQRHGVPGEALWLEITESVMIEDSVATVSVMSGLRSLGVRLAVDDFGTGFSSLSYLKRFPVSRVKIDRAFVTGLSQSESDRSLVAAIVAMADALGLETVAEGVETEEQLERLLELGCRHMQGYLFGSAVPPADVPLVIRRLGGTVPRARARTRRCVTPTVP